MERRWSGCASTIVPPPLPEHAAAPFRQLRTPPVRVSRVTDAPRGQRVVDTRPRPFRERQGHENVMKAKPHSTRVAKTPTLRKSTITSPPPRNGHRNGNGNGNA